MEGMLTEFVVSSGVLLSALALLVLVFGGALLGRLAEEERRGKRFFWAESASSGIGAACACPSAMRCARPEDGRHESPRDSPGRPRHSCFLSPVRSATNTVEMRIEET